VEPVSNLLSADKNLRAGSVPGPRVVSVGASSIRGGATSDLPPDPRRLDYVAGVAAPTGAQSLGAAIASGVPVPSMRAMVPPPLAAPMAGMAT
jgi:hypothetical protein